MTRHRCGGSCALRQRTWISGAASMFLALCLVMAFSPVSASADVSGELLRITENIYLVDSNEGAPGLDQLAEPEFVLEVYELTRQQPLWDSQTAEQALALLKQSRAEGLNPSDYHVGAIEQLAGPQPALSLQQLALRDFLLTDGVLHYARHLVEGKLEPRTLDPSWNYTRRDYSAVEVASRPVTEMVMAAWTT